MDVPAYLRRACQGNPSAENWLSDLPQTIERLSRAWGLSLHKPLQTEASCSWVAPVTTDRGERLILKLGMPHMESRDEAQGLRLWDGRGAVRVHKVDEVSGAILMERCLPGHSLRREPPCEQDGVLCKLLRKLWVAAPEKHGLRPISDMLEYWIHCTLEQRGDWTDAGLVQAGIERFRGLLTTSSTEFLLCTDLHAGNILSSEREPWLMIDPKPFVGDPAYDITQHLFNCPERLKRDPKDLIGRVADLLELAPERITDWLFARAAADPRSDWSKSWAFQLAYRL